MAPPEDQGAGQITSLLLVCRLERDAGRVVVYRQCLKAALGLCNRRESCDGVSRGTGRGHLSEQQ